MPLTSRMTISRSVILKKNQSKELEFVQRMWSVVSHEVTGICLKVCRCLYKQHDLFFFFFFPAYNNRHFASRMVGFGSCLVSTSVQEICMSKLEFFSSLRLLVVPSPSPPPPPPPPHTLNPQFLPLLKVKILISPNSFEHSVICKQSNSKLLLPSFVTACSDSTVSFSK